MVAVEHDHPGAGAEDGAPEVADRLVEAVEVHQPRERRRLAARDHEAVEARRAARACAPRRRRRRGAAASRRARGSCPARQEHRSGSGSIATDRNWACNASDGERRRRPARARVGGVWGIADFSGGLVVAARADDPGHRDLPGGRLRGAARGVAIAGGSSTGARSASALLAGLGGGSRPRGLLPGALARDDEHRLAGRRLRRRRALRHLDRDGRAARRPLARGRRPRDRRRGAGLGGGAPRGRPAPRRARSPWRSSPRSRSASSPTSSASAAARAVRSRR